MFEMRRYGFLVIFLAILLIASTAFPATVVIEAEAFGYSYDYIYEPIRIFPDGTVPSGAILLGLDAPDEFTTYFNIQVGVAGVYTITMRERGGPMGTRFLLDAILTDTSTQESQTVEIMFTGAGTG